MQQEHNSIRLGISRCLLGEKVRYDGNHKLDRYLVGTLGKFVQWVGVCPEVESGLGVPREPMRLVEKGGKVSLVTINSAKDHTDTLVSWSKNSVKELRKLNLAGFIFKCKSPSSALRDAKIYGENGYVQGKGPGLFAKEFIERNSWIPAEDDGRLHDPAIRENFIERVFVYARWCELIKSKLSIDTLINWHADHKLQLMAHSPSKTTALGNMLGTHDKRVKRLYYCYFFSMMQILKETATVKKNVNALQHIAGYFKSDLSKQEKQEIVEVIENYHQSQVPLIVPITLLNHFVRKYDKSYLLRQVYLNPHPLELKLRTYI